MSFASCPVDMFSNADTLQCVSLVGSPGNVVSQPSRHVSNPGPQRQFPTQMKVSDTAQSISFAMKGDIDGLKYLFSQGLASPRDVSSSRGFSLVSVGLTTPFPPQPCFLRLLGNAEILLVGALWWNVQL